MILNYKDLKSTIMPNKSNTIETLRTSGLRPTKQRVQLAKFLFDRDKTFHFNVEDLHKTINLKNNKKISLATIYNTVHAFKNAGYLKEILIKNNKSFFDTNTEVHHHFFDEKNNLLTDVSAEEISIKKIPSPPAGKFIKQVEVIINIANDNQKQ